MNKVISSIMDIDGYHSRISTIESTNDALRMSSKIVHVNSKMVDKFKFDYTSKLVRAVFNKPSTNESRLLLQSRKISQLCSPITTANRVTTSAPNKFEELGEGQDDMTTEQRLQLYKIALAKIEKRRKKKIAK